MKAPNLWRLPAWGLCCAGLAASHALAAAPVAVNFASQTALEPAGIALDAWAFAPAGPADAPRPAVVMMHGCSGPFSGSNPLGNQLASQFIGWGERLTDAGYLVLLVDSFTPRYRAENVANGLDPNAGLDGRNECSNGADGVSEVEQRSHDAQWAYEFMQTPAFAAQFGAVDAANVVLLGWSHGGSSVLAALDATLHGATPRFRAGVSNYPGCGLFGALPGYRPYAPLLMLHAETDPLYQSGFCAGRIAGAKSLPDFATFFEMIVYRDAGHSFDIGGASGTAEGNARAREHARERIMEFFGIHARGVGTLATSVLAPGSYLYSTVPVEPMLPPDSLLPQVTGLNVDIAAVALDLAALIDAPLFDAYSGPLVLATGPLPPGISLQDTVVAGAVGAFDDTGSASFLVYASNADGLLVEEVSIAQNGAVSTLTGFVLPSSAGAVVPATPTGGIDVPLAPLAQSSFGLEVRFSAPTSSAGLAIVDGRLVGGVDAAALPLQLAIAMDSNTLRLTRTLEISAAPGGGFALQWVGEALVSEAPSQQPDEPGGGGEDRGGGSADHTLLILSLLALWWMRRHPVRPALLRR